MHRIISALFLTAILVPSSVFGQSDFERWEILAEAGDATAQNSLGIMYTEGLVGPQNSTEALKWYQLAAEQGHSEAQYNFGVMHFFGQGVPQNNDEALTWFRLAAEQGYADAQNNLGTMHQLGQRGVSESYRGCGVVSTGC